MVWNSFHACFTWIYDHFIMFIFLLNHSFKCSSCIQPFQVLFWRKVSCIMVRLFKRNKWGKSKGWRACFYLFISQDILTCLYYNDFVLTNVINIGAKRAGKVGVQNENSDLFSKIRDLFNKIRDLFSTTRLRDQKNNGCTCTRCTR